MTDAPLLTVQDLVKHYPIGGSSFSGRHVSSVKAVDGVDFEIDRGKTLALVGESGCGKTTTARMVLRLEDTTRGSVLLDGRDVHRLRSRGLREYRRRVQAVFQDPWASLNPRMRVKDLIAEPLILNRKVSRKEVTTRVEKVLDEVGLRPQYAWNYPHEFSGGQRQRIAVAAALISEPDLIVLDEPVSALDVSIRSQVMNLLKDLQATYGVSYLLIAHDLGTTRYMADEVAVMYLGRIVERGSTEDVFDRHKHPYTEALLSAALPAHPGKKNKQIVLRGEVPSPVNPPHGCPFHTRCHVKLGARCETEVPILQRVETDVSGHVAACHRIG